MTAPAVYRAHKCLLLFAALSVGMSCVISPPARASERRFERQLDAGEARILRVKPAVVTVFTEVSAEVTIRCGDKPPVQVTPDPVMENGTGFIIHPDGWIATNGHVVKPVYADDEEQISTFVQAGAELACSPLFSKLPESVKQERLKAIVNDPENRRGVKLTKKLWVDLAQRLADGTPRLPYPAVVKAYSPPIDPDRLPKGGAKPDPPMLDAAIIKIAATNLPTVRLAPGIDYVHLGEELFIIGYPGVVLWHSFLSEVSRTEATVTFGRVSSFKRDINGRRILQTDAAISWGNSGGPAFNGNDEVVGVATFISTSLEGDQAIQGFNFLIPVDTILSLAEQAGVVPVSEGAFMQSWQAAVNAYFKGRFSTALAQVEAAEKVTPDLLDVHLLRMHLEKILREHPSWDTERREIFGGAVAVALGGAIVIFCIGFGIRKIRKRKKLSGHLSAR